MSGLPPPSSYLTPPDVRFEQMLESVKTYKPLQIGITLFRNLPPREPNGIPNGNKEDQAEDQAALKAETHTFYCWNPFDTSFGSPNTLTLNTSSANFLKSHNFSFDACISTGLPLHTSSFCSKARSTFSSSYPPLRPLPPITLPPPIPPQYLLTISQTLTSVRTYLDTSSSPTFLLPPHPPNLRKLERSVINSTFPSLIITDTPSGNKISRLTSSEKTTLYTKTRSYELNKVNSMCYLSEIWSSIKKHKIIVHNGMYTIMLLENYLSSALKTWEDFKGRLEEIDFYDTKYMGDIMLRDEGFYGGMGLERMYEYWKGREGRRVEGGGGDSYCTGYVYAQMGEGGGGGKFYVMRSYYIYGREGVEFEDVWIRKLEEGEESSGKICEWKGGKYVVERKERPEKGGTRGEEWDGEERVGWVEWVLGKKRKRD
ncbi:hypothetical protein TrVE_jg13097 [Triparma verrucosa]|uniref:Uncharacterized protein n=1 Tax=Triparma verrucosa TaxID=1606542 RepID=A0A9W7BNJ3_9STRA|nr:hypothetical protein TrVE_jg13097 [Triparma verrucosa]